MDKILITGYNGFIGKNLIKALNGYWLIGVDLKCENTVSKHLFWAEITEIDNCDCMIHLAGKAHDTENNKDSQEYFDVNVNLTKKIFDVFLNSNAKKFIYFSSVAAVTDSMPSGEILSESSVPNPLTHYGKSKLAAEQFINEQILPFGKKVYILRPSMVHGPGNRGNLPMLFNFLQKGIPWPLGAYKNKRTFTYIGNLLFVLQQLIERDIQSGTYHIVDDESVSTNDLVRTILNSLKMAIRILYIPPFFVNFLAKIGDLFGLPLNSFRLKKLTTSFEVSNKKIKDSLGIQKMPFKAIDGLEISINELTKNLNLQ